LRAPTRPNNYSHAPVYALAKWGKGKKNFREKPGSPALCLSHRTTLNVGGGKKGGRGKKKRAMERDVFFAHKHAGGGHGGKGEKTPI